MSPLLVYALVFIGVSAVIGVLFFIFGEGTAKTAERLDMLTGKKRREDETTTILRRPPSIATRNRCSKRSRRTCRRCRS